MDPDGYIPKQSNSYKTWNAAQRSWQNLLQQCSLMRKNLFKNVACPDITEESREKNPRVLELQASCFGPQQADKGWCIRCISRLTNRKLMAVLLWVDFNSRMTAFPKKKEKDPGSWGFSFTASTLLSILSRIVMNWSHVLETRLHVCYGLKASKSGSVVTG